MASLVLGGIGGFLFGPIGFMAGSLIGNLLSPGKQEGPRLSNLKLQGSSYGQMIPIAYGTIRLSGQVCWQTDLVEQKHTSGGKGGPEVTTYTYTVSFAVKICKGPIAGLLKIWANGEVIYDTTSGATADNSAVPVTVYLGVETELPDPTMETILGVGNVPAFRDDAAVVFSDWDMGRYGNTLPQLSFEIFTHEGGQVPQRINTWDVFGAGDGPWARFDGPCGITLDTDGTLKIARYDANNNHDAPPLTYVENRYTQDGVLVGNITTMGVSDPHAGVFTVWKQCQNCNVAYLHTFDGSTVQGYWYTNGVPTAGPLAGVSGVADAVSSPGYYANGFIYVTGGPNGGGYVGKWEATDGTPTGVAPVATYSLDDAKAGSAYDTTVDENGDVWVTGTGTSGFFNPLWHFDKDLNLIHYWPWPTGPQYAVDSAHGFAVFKDFIAYRNTTGSGSNVIVYRVNSDLTFSVQGQQIAAGTGGIVRLSNCLCICDDGMIDICPQPAPITLAEIVSDVSVRCGLSTSDIDVSQLTDLVDGYLITTQADARTDIDQLRTAYFFDAVESQGIAKFVKRGSQPVVTIPDNDLAAQQRTETPPPLVEVLRAQEIDLVAAVNVKYLNSGAAYQDGTQQAIRQATISQSVANVSLAIAMSDTKGRQIANVLLYETVIERNSVKFRTSRQYLYLEPTDVISAHGYTIRIERKSATVAGLVEFEGKLSIPTIYIIALSANATSGGQQPSTSVAQPTQLLLLDLPLLTDTDATQGFYAAMAGAVDSTWRGATLFKSIDGGVTYTQIGAEAVPQVIGAAATELPDYGGGNTVDELSTLSVVVGPGGGTLASIDLPTLLNGGNKALVGQELIQYRDAVLTAPSTYALAGFLRGRRGTESEMGNHIVGEQFVAFPALNVDDPFSELGLARFFKAVTANSGLAAATPRGFRNMGGALRPYAPVQVYGAVNGAGDITIVWTRRTRVGGAWVNLTDVPLSESSERYVLQVWNADYTLCARVVTGITSPTFVYTSAMQVTDFGAQQQTVYITVGQLGTFGLGSQAHANFAGAGGSNVDPLNPVQPYNTLPPPSPPGPGCLGTVINDTFAWTAGNQLLSPVDFGPGQTWVLKIPVPASPTLGGGNISGVEFAGGPIPRQATLSLNPCGPPLIPTSQTNAGDVAFRFYFKVGPNAKPQVTPTFLPSTNYYISITTSAVGQMLATLNPSR